MKISIQNLKQGLTSFSEEIKPDFVSGDLIDYYPDNFFVDVLLDKIDHDFMVKVKLKSKAHYVCDRCLEGFDTDIELHQDQLYKTGPFDIEKDRDIIPLPADLTEIDLTDFLNEAVLVNHPIKMLCKEDCKGICPGCGVNLNENECICNKASGDPRWDELRKLIK
jgi:uncharacterized protein